jgi:IrrE N-terminal-like domain
VVETRLHAARFAARRLLLKLYRDSDEAAAGEILATASDRAAEDLGLTVDLVPAIAGGTQIAGVLDRDKMMIQIATGFRVTSQRFTLAHEIGHYFLHTGIKYFRDRELVGPDRERDPVEAEADAFAAEFLMPRKFLELVFSGIFGGPVTQAEPDPDIIAAVRRPGSERLTARDFASLEPLECARAIATAQSYRGRMFAPLTEQFGVSSTAMGIQLLDAGLVK